MISDPLLLLGHNLGLSPRQGPLATALSTVAPSAQMTFISAIPWERVHTPPYVSFSISHSFIHIPPKVMHGTHRATGKEYAVKILDKSHLFRHNKLPTALAEKNTLVRLGAGHPGFVKLHWTFQDEYSLCEF
jgi:hypothetical protein